MIIKKLLIIKSKVTEYKDKNGKVIKTHYEYPKNYNARHAKHICYNFANAKKLKGNHLAEGMVIYEAEEREIKLLIQRNGVEEISYNDAKIKGKKWKPKMTIDTSMGKIKKKEFDIKDWIKNKTKISNKKLI